MNKSTFFSGQPIFSQLLKFIPRDKIMRIALDARSDHYCKRFNTYEHLVTMLYSVFNNCNSIREVTTGMLASEQRLSHLGIRYYPRRSTLADANIRREASVFETIYFTLFKKYASFLSDSRKTSKASRIYILDSTTISLFHEVLRTGGPTPASGRRKGGIKVQTMIRSDQDVPCMIYYGSGVSNDSQFLKQVQLPKGSILLFDRGYHHFATFNRFTQESVTWVTRRTSFHAMTMNEQIIRSADDDCLISDTHIVIGHEDTKDKVKARLIQYLDTQTGEVYEYVTNNLRMNAETIPALYKKRWQIETLFKRLKQNYPLKYFLGDSENAIKIQIWCSLIADLLLKLTKKAAGVRWSFSNLAAMVRLHLMTYIDLFSFLKSPEKALLRLFYTQKIKTDNQLLLIT